MSTPDKLANILPAHQPPFRKLALIHKLFKGRVDQILKAKIAARFNKLLATAPDFQFSRALKSDKVLGRFVK